MPVEAVGRTDEVICRTGGPVFNGDESIGRTDERTGNCWHDTGRRVLRSGRRGARSARLGVRPGGPGVRLAERGDRTGGALDGPEGPPAGTWVNELPGLRGQGPTSARFPLPISPFSFLLSPAFPLLQSGVAVVFELSRRTPRNALESICGHPYQRW